MEAMQMIELQIKIGAKCIRAQGSLREGAGAKGD